MNPTKSGYYKATLLNNLAECFIYFDTQKGWDSIAKVEGWRPIKCKAVLIKGDLKYAQS